jgi:hypothetical protein
MGIDISYDHIVMHVRMILRNEIPSKWIRGYGIGWNAITLTKEVMFPLRCDQCSKGSID